ncbi:MAG TPA: phosphatase domain-containing protein [Polyangiaceae bacterium]
MHGPPEESADTRAARFRQRAWASGLRWLAQLELRFDRVFWWLRRRLGRLGPLQLVAFRSFGTAERALLRGRVLEASALERSLPEDSRWRNVRRMLRRFNSRELPAARVRARLGERVVEGTTDDEGYFELAIAPADGEQRWREPELEVVAAPLRGLVPVRAMGELLVPGAAELGLVSDIDDTVLQTHVTQKLKMIWITLSGSAFTRMPFEGTAELYRALVAGASGQAENPVFYVSKSPWNLYDFLIDFLEHHGLPRGPLLLRDIGLREAPPLDHKSAALRELLETYPALPFVLVGDSGERDAEIYLETASRYPGRVRAIYIRDLDGTRATRPQSAELVARARACGTELLWVAHARQALEHARSLGLAR